MIIWNEKKKNQQLENVTVFLPHEAGLLELELHLLGGVQVVQDHEALGKFVGLQLAKVDWLSAKSGHRTIIGEVSAAQGHIFEELLLDGFILFEMVALTS